MVKDRGWLRPDYYTTVEDEVQVTRERVGLSDVSPVTKFDIQGKDTLSALVQRLSLAATLQGGQVVRLSPQTLSIDSEQNRLDGRLCCLTQDHAFLITPPSTAVEVRQTLSPSNEPAPNVTCFHMTEVTSSFTAVQIVGPQGYELLRKLTSLDLSPTAFPDLSCAQGGVAKVHALVMRADVQTQLGYEVYCRREFGEYIWQTLHDAGQEFGVVPFGIAAELQLYAEK